MARNQNTGRLIVMEYGGTARSGKGSIVRHLGQTHKGVVSDETGADYRTVAKHLLVEQKVREGMPGASISTIAAGLGERALTDVVARRREIIDAHSFDSLYERDVSMVVPHVARVEEVRNAVKVGFVRRVEAVRDNYEDDILVVDGRNLGPLVGDIPDVQLVMRSFLTCSAEEAAARECARQEVAIDTSEGARLFVETRDMVARRNQADASRELDPVVIDANAISYWLAGDALDLGYSAAVEGRQIAFNTTPFRERYPEAPRQAMLTEADLMFQGALQAVGVQR